MRIFDPIPRKWSTGYNSTPDKDSNSKGSGSLKWSLKTAIGPWIPSWTLQSSFIWLDELSLLVERIRIDLVNCLEGIMFEGLHFWRASCLIASCLEASFRGLSCWWLHVWRLEKVSSYLKGFMFEGLHVWWLHVWRASCLMASCLKGFMSDGFMSEGILPRVVVSMASCLKSWKRFIMLEGLHVWRSSFLKGFMFEGLHVWWLHVWRHLSEGCHVDGFMFEGLNVFMFGGYRVWRWKSMVFMSEELHVGRASCLKVLNGHWTSADNCPRRFGADGESHTHTPVWPDKFIKVKLKTAFWSLFGPDRMNRYPCWFRKLFELSWIEIDCIISWLNWRADMCTWRVRMSRFLSNRVTWFSIPLG